ncbi:Os10g0193900 [Oryza sativa Japonica Group]|nr:hypothetical protein LOC_Os10g11770 [Oryza sativa Japonica Group]EEE50695.1 hypothetical protein OsJ_30962 [Oryza sativa Japonica Group]BAT10201.1 Os10g0193900 [Oryza sativa Japonica Group]
MVSLCSSSRFDLVFEMKGRWRREGAAAMAMRLNEAVWHATGGSVWRRRQELAFLWADCESGYDGPAAVSPFSSSKSGNGSSDGEGGGWWPGRRWRWSSLKDLRCQIRRLAARSMTSSMRGEVRN